MLEIIIASILFWMPVNHSVNQVNSDKPIGMGIASPTLENGEVLYFYGPPEDGFQLPDMLTPQDSLVFAQGEHYVDISYAPPYFVPEVMKLDYGFLMMKVLTVTKYFLEVEVNTYNQQTVWVSREAVGYKTWEDFFLNVYAVEVLNPEENPLKIKPLDHASVLATSNKDFPLQVVAVKGDWLKVSTNGLADRIKPYGWIKWRANGKLLISYSILS